MLSKPSRSIGISQVNRKPPFAPPTHPPILNKSWISLAEPDPQVLKPPITRSNWEDHYAPLGTNIFHFKDMFESWRWFPFPQVGYVSCLEGTSLFHLFWSFRSPAKREAPWSPSLWNRTEERVIGCCDGDDILSYVYIILYLFSCDFCYVYVYSYTQSTYWNSQIMGTPYRIPISCSWTSMWVSISGEYDTSWCVLVAVSSRESGQFHYRDRNGWPLVLQIV